MSPKNKFSLDNLDLNNKNVLVRVDFNVPLDKNGKITDDSRIEAAVPTIKKILEKGGRPILMSHLGRPNGKINLEFSLAPCAKRLMTMLGRPVVMATDCIGDSVKKLIANMGSHEVLLLENLRFHPGEENPASDPSFAKNLAELGDAYVNDAFGTAHRAHSSTAAIAQYFPGKSAIGLLFEKEIEFLGDCLLKPRRPFYAIIGGAKVSTKLGVLKSLISKIDVLFIGGAMAYTFLKAEGVQIGTSAYEPNLVDTARGIMDSYKTAGITLRLPVDHVIVQKVENNASRSIANNADGIPPGFIGVDIGPETLKQYIADLELASTIFWNGPMGIFEMPNFAKGTFGLAEALANMKSIRIVGGGDSVSAIRAVNLAHRFTFLSTGGGASLEFLEFGTLPGIEALKFKKNINASNSEKDTDTKNKSCKK